MKLKSNENTKKIIEKKATGGNRKQRKQYTKTVEKLMSLGNQYKSMIEAGNDEKETYHYLNNKWVRFAKEINEKSRKTGFVADVQGFKNYIEAEVKPNINQDE